MNLTTTARGFALMTFEDSVGVACSLQKSSAVTEDKIWLGCDDAAPQVFVPGEGWQAIAMPANYLANTRMHLTREQVAALLPHLQRFVDTGELTSN
jgi:hypothetical protein